MDGRSIQILEALLGWLEEVGAPDIVLFSSPAGNDALEGRSFDDAVANVTAIIDQLHYNQAGANFVADRYFTVLEDVFESE